MENNFKKGETILEVNILTNVFGLKTILDITPSGIIKCNNINFTQDGYPYGYKSFKKKRIIEHNEDIFMANRIIKIDENIINELKKAINNAKEMK